MSATLYRGIKQLHLMLTPPYDITQPEEQRVRDDLIGVKVWISTTAGFTPNPANALDFAAGSSIILNDLQTNTRYYVRYAFISKIEPTIFTISDELTAKTYDELTSVYGELTNDPVYLARQQNSTELDWTIATGTFRVWEYNIEVTGNNVLYEVVPNSATNGLVATINPATGEFYASGWTAGTRTAKISFSATYEGITIVRDWNIVDGVGQDAPQITLTVSPDTFVYKNDTAKLADTIEVTATAQVFNLVGNPTFEVKAYTREGSYISDVTYTPVPNNPKSISITRQQFHVNDTIGYITVKAYIGDIFDQDTVPRLNNGTNEITVDLDNPVVQLQATETGQVDPAEYAESGTRITVYEGATKLAISTSGGLPATWAAGTWDITTINGVGIIPDDDWTEVNNSIVFGSHSGMSQDTAFIDYTITYKTLAGLVAERVVKQKFAKSKQGFPGISAPIVSIKGSQVFIRPANEPATATTPNYIDLVAATSNITNPVFEWRVDGVVQAGETESDFRVQKFTNVSSKTIRVDVEGLNSQGEQISQFDEITVYYVESGNDAIVAFCTPEFTGISCDSQGIPETTQFPFYIDTTVLRGGTVLSNTTTPNTIVYQINPLSLVGILPQDISINQTTGLITLADIQNTFSSFAVNFTVGSTTITKVVRLNKILEGNSAPIVVLTATNQIFVKAKNDGAVYPANTTITATAINVTDPQYSWTVDGVGQPQFNNDAEIQIASFEGNPKLVQCTVTSTSNPSVNVFDKITLYSVKEGDDSLIFALSNENQTLTCDKDGVPVAGQFPIQTDLTVLQGSSVIAPPAVSFSIVSQTGTNSANVSITGSTLSISSGGIQGDFAEIELKATVGTTELFKKLTISKSKEGETGAQIATVYIYARNNSATAPALTGNSGAFVYNFSTGLLNTNFTNWSQNIPDVSQGSVIWVSQATVRSAPGGTVSINTLTWSTPVVLTSTGDSVDIIFRRSSSQPSTPAASSGTPSGWYSSVDDVPVTTDILWSSVGTRQATGGGLFTWNTPVQVEGSTGAAGLSVAEITIYKRSAVALTAAPTGGSYNFSTRTITVPTDGGSTWSTIIPTGTDPIYISRAVASVQGITGIDSTLTWTTPVLSIKNGDDGINTATVALYAKNTSSTTAPSSFSGNFTYTFSTAGLVANQGASFNGWTTTAPNINNGEYLWVRYATAASNTASDIITTNDFSTPIVIAIGGTNGTNGTNTATVALYAKNTSASTAPNSFTGTFTYTFNTAQLTADAGSNFNTWTTTAPSITNGEYLWVRYAVASSNTTTDTIAANEFSGAVVSAVGGVNGTNGINSATIALYIKNTNPTTAPSSFTGTFTYNFITAQLTADAGSNFNSWSTSAPSIGKGEYLWVRYAVASSNTSTDTIAANEFSSAVISAVGGIDGNPGATGAPAKTIDISGIGTFTVNTADQITPASITLTAQTQNITSPSYSWSATNASLSSTTTISTVVTPLNSSVTSITVQLTVTEPSTGATFTKSVILAVAQRGVTGQTGARGIMSAVPSVYQWTGSSTAPATGTLNSTTYTWETGAYTAPTGWSTTVPTNTTPGYYLWQLSIPLTVSGTTTESQLNWAGLSPRAVAYNGINGSDGANGDPGAPGAAGSATYLITRVSGATISQPTSAEVTAAVGRSVVNGDIATVTNGGNSITYRYIANAWNQVSAYITGSLIVEGTITGDKITANSLTVDKITSGTTSTINNGNFALGGSAQAIGIGTVIAARRTSANGWAIAGLNDGSGVGGAGIVGGAISTNAAGIVGANAADTNYNQLRTLGAVAWSSSGLLGRYLRVDGSGNPFADNNAQTPRSQGDIGLFDRAGLFRWFSNSGSTTLRQVSFANENYAIEVDTGDTYLKTTVVDGNCRIATSLGVGTTASGNAGEIRATGNIIAYFSDDRLKTNLGNIQNALEKLKSLSGFYYTPNALAQKLGYSSSVEVGVSAQKVKAVLPEAVAPAPIGDQYLTVKYERLAPLIIEAIKELDEKLTAIKEAVDAYTNRTDRAE